MNHQTKTKSESTTAKHFSAPKLLAAAACASLLLLGLLNPTIAQASQPQYPPVLAKAVKKCERMGDELGTRFRTYFLNLNEQVREGKLSAAEAERLKNEWADREFGLVNQKCQQLIDEAFEKIDQKYLENQLPPDPTPDFSLAVEGTADGEFEVIANLYNHLQVTVKAWHYVVVDSQQVSIGATRDCQPFFGDQPASGWLVKNQPMALKTTQKFGAIIDSQHANNWVCVRAKTQDDRAFYLRLRLPSSVPAVKTTPAPTTTPKTTTKTTTTTPPTTTTTTTTTETETGTETTTTPPVLTKKIKSPAPAKTTTKKTGNQTPNPTTSTTNTNSSRRQPLIVSRPKSSGSNQAQAQANDSTANTQAPAPTPDNPDPAVTEPVAPEPAPGQKTETQPVQPASVAQPENNPGSQSPAEAVDSKAPTGQLQTSQTLRNFLISLGSSLLTAVGLSLLLLKRTRR